MFNTYSEIEIKNKQSFNYNINAVSGTIRKSHPKSIITKVSLNDTLLDKINPRYEVVQSVESNFKKGSYYCSNKNYPVAVLQVMLCGNNECLVEFVEKEEFQIVELNEKKQPWMDDKT